MASNRYIHAVSRAPNQLTSTERSPPTPRHRARFRTRAPTGAANIQAMPRLPAIGTRPLAQSLSNPEHFVDVRPRDSSRANQRRARMEPSE